jgi:hypothetical protein
MFLEDGLRIYRLLRHLMVRVGKRAVVQVVRDAVWTVDSCELSLGSYVRKIHSGDVAHVSVGKEYSVSAASNVRIVEVRYGNMTQC